MLRRNARAIYNRVMESIAPKVKRAILNEYDDYTSTYSDINNNSYSNIRVKQNRYLSKIDKEQLERQGYRVPMSKDELLDCIDEQMKSHNPDYSKIITTNITDMSNLFYTYFSNIGEYDLHRNFNGDISMWDVSNVTNMHSMFEGCESFNQDISDWDVSNVENMSRMFVRCMHFNQDISKWAQKLSNVTTMTQMFVINNKI